MAEEEDQDATPGEPVADPGTPTSPQPAEGATKDVGEPSTKWKHYPLRDKLRVVEFLRGMREREHGHPEAATIAYFEKQDPPMHLTRKTIHKWEETRERLQKALDDEENGEPQPKKPRKSKNPAVEAQLLNFCKWAHEQNIPLTGPLLKQKLKIYQERLGGVELVGSNGWLQAFYGYYGIKLAGSKEMKAAQRALEDAEFSDDPDGKKRRLRKRRAAAKKRRARAKALREGREPGEEDDESDDDDDADDDDDQEQQQQQQQPPPTGLYPRPAPIITNGARAPPATIATAPARPRAKPRASAKLTTAKKGPGGPNGKTPAARVNATTQPRPTTTMQIQHLTQQQNQPDTMMQWDDGNYQANPDMDDSGEDEYYSAGTFGNQAGNTAIGAGWSVLDTEKILKVRNAATTLLGLALERTDVGPNDMQQSMISVLDWCRRQEESLPHVIPPPPQEQPRLHNVASTYPAPPASTTTSSRLPAQYATHTHVGSSAQPTYAQDHHGYTTNEQYSAPSYSTLASAAAAAPTSYQLPHSASSYGSAQPYHPTQAYNNAQTYSTQYNTHNYPSSHSYNNRIGL